MHPVVYLAHIADELSSKHNVVPVLGVINTSEKLMFLIVVYLN